ncbi:DUF2441 domain-containing protein [Brachyspira aalborgi]|uniref:DUF2441 domain-containing protein n=1 Tax=Brachyspira aalborgi TaxID=29522 RepID=A0A5C8EDJ1_9SPIR|nr:DUF2441 domain-containing protein [Brachyspira aalborgi]TXJ34712.1 DUF2441 domain-containing protein [Brachyspira aalborgi]
MNMPQKEYFKVIENTYIEENKTFDTVQINHRNGNLSFYSNLKHFFDKICELDERYNYGLDLYIELLYRLIIFGLDLYTEIKNNLDYYQMLCNSFKEACLDLYVQLAKATINGKDDEDLLFNLIENNSDKFFVILKNKYGKKINISEFTKNNNKNKININKLYVIYQELKPIINSEILVADIGVYLSEYIFEEMRKNNFSDKISRLDSYFVFKDIKSCDYYKKRWKKHNNSIVKIIPKNVDNYFEGDIKHIDDIENHITVYEYQDIANKYWQGKFTNDPIIETFFQGTFEMKRL